MRVPLGLCVYLWSAGCIPGQGLWCWVLIRSTSTSCLWNTDCIPGSGRAGLNTVILPCWVFYPVNTAAWLCSFVCISSDHSPIISSAVPCCHIRLMTFILMSSLHLVVSWKVKHGNYLSPSLHPCLKLETNPAIIGRWGGLWGNFFLLLVCVYFYFGFDVVFYSSSSFLL